MKSRWRGLRGFSLLELFIVICFIIAGTFLYLWWGGISMERAWQASCLANMKQLGVALSMYASDWDGWLPPGRGWIEAIDPYCKNRQILVCPISRRKLHERTEDERTEVVSYIYRTGHRTDENPRTVILYEPVAWHLGRGNVFFLSGRVEGLTETELRKMELRLYRSSREVRLRNIPMGKKGIFGNMKEIEPP